MHMLDLIWKSAVIYAALILFMRLMGKRQLGDLELSELIVTVLISEVAAAPLVEKDAALTDGNAFFAGIRTVELHGEKCEAPSATVREAIYPGSPGTDRSVPDEEKSLYPRRIDGVASKPGNS